MHDAATALAKAEQAGYEGEELVISDTWDEDLKLAARTVHGEGLRARAAEKSTRLTRALAKAQGAVEASWDADILADCNGADDRALSIR